MILSVEEISDLKMYQDAENYSKSIYKEDADEKDIFFFVHQKEGEENYED